MKKKPLHTPFSNTNQSSENTSSIKEQALSPKARSVRALTRTTVGWMAANPVAANLLMVVMVVGGLLFASQIRKEVFPAFDLDLVTVTVSYDGATPEEIELSIVKAVEEAVQGLDGVKETTATISAGRGTVSIEANEGADGNILLQDVKAAVDRISTLPEDADSPDISLRSLRREVVSLVLTGGGTQQAQRYWAELIRDELAQDGEITQVELDTVLDHEVLIEIPQDTLRRYNLTINEVATAIRSSAIQQGGGTVQASSGDIMLRLNERRDYAADFANVAIRTNADGSRLLLDDIAVITDTFDDAKRWAEFNGQEALLIEVYSIGEETPESVSIATRRIVDRFNASMPGDLQLHVLDDSAEVYLQREELLIKNALQGVLLVFLCLAIFLRPSLALWVSLGIPVSMLGAFWFFDIAGQTINMMTLFAFIITLGIVVDDAIVVGENVSSWQERGYTPLEAAIRGTEEVSGPVVFSVLTNMVAFMPMLFIPGTMGKIWMTIPVVVMAVFFCSLLESLYVLPAHLSHTRYKPPLMPKNTLQTTNEVSKNIFSRGLAAFAAWQQRFSHVFLQCVEKRFGGILYKVLQMRYVTFCCGVLMLLITVGYVVSGRMGFDLMPRTEADFAFASADLPAGAPRTEIDKVKNRLVNAAKQLVEEHGGEALSEGIFTQVRDTELFVYVMLVDPEIRPMSTEAFTTLWRQRVGVIPSVENLEMQADRGGPGSGKGLSVRLSHRDTAVLEQAAEDFATRLTAYAAIGDVDTGTSRTTRQFDVTLKPLAEQLGLTAQEISSQLRSAFEGSVVLRQQRDYSEVTVRVRLPEEERTREATFEELILRTPNGREVLLRDVTDLEDGRADSVIRHTNGRRTATVEANVTPPSATGQMMSTVTDEIMPALLQDYNGLSWEFSGRQSDMRDSTTAMLFGLLFALLGVYALLAIPFKSYTQPLIIMLTIPFGMVGAVLGHLIMGYSLSVISLFGLVALSGVVVNDSLVLIDFANRRRLEGMSAFEAVRQAAIQRFRPILLTTITTFVGLAPLIFETSRQAQMLVPVALSLGFGIIFATFMCLVLVPALYLILDDVHRLIKH